jgi:large subunit ribosomal protein L18
MMNKKQARLRRARQTRIRIAQQQVHRLVVNRSNQHIYGQVYSTCGQKVLVSVSTLDAEVKQILNGQSGGNKSAAIVAGSELAKRTKAAGIGFVVFDRSGFRFHGRVKAFADAVTENGVSFKR